MTRVRVSTGAAGERLVSFEGELPAPMALRSVGLAELLAMDLPPRENLLAPFLPRQGLVMLYAGRGVGKTHVSLGIAYAVASGGRFLHWEAPEPAGVLYLDGEMPAVVMQERLAGISMASAAEPVAPFRVITPDLQPSGMPDLATMAGQALIDAQVTDDTALIVVDNLSTLCRSGEENAAEGWLPIQTWALRHRAAGRSVLFVHHAGKGGAQRGTSRREDVLDTVINLKRPSDYVPADGARFEVHFEKARGIHGKEVNPFEARLQLGAGGELVWAIRSLEDSTFERVVQLTLDGLSQKEIVAELGVDKSRVSRHLKRARQEGRVHEQPR